MQYERERCLMCCRARSQERSFFSLLGRRKKGKASEAPRARTRAERRAERWERHRNFERVRFEDGTGALTV